MSQISNPALIPPGGLGPDRPVGPSAPGQSEAARRPPGAPAGAPGAGVPSSGAPGSGASGASAGPSFADALDRADQAQALSFSRHALARAQRRGIELDAGTLGRLADGVSRAAGKGSRDSLVLVDGTAFVVSVSNRTVITAVGSEQMKDNVFTNIDSAVIA